MMQVPPRPAYDEILRTDLVVARDLDVVARLRNTRQFEVEAVFSLTAAARDNNKPY